eukprot:TRINITY_DN37412_c0_g1_i1.p1 TRINITY_DN37412_c0_g1~~TRINITY_DN37412_c0_g1_i1.p1  ORF type:complete len:1126 (+),score=182.88 TRINITY_DN37412_c0_g1_i1:115-3378(+)
MAVASPVPWAEIATMGHLSSPTPSIPSGTIHNPWSLTSCGTMSFHSRLGGGPHLTSFPCSGNAAHRQSSAPVVRTMRVSQGHASRQVPLCSSPGALFVGRGSAYPSHVGSPVVLTASSPSSTVASGRRGVGHWPHTVRVNAPSTSAASWIMPTWSHCSRQPSNSQPAPLCRRTSTLALSPPLVGSQGVPESVHLTPPVTPPVTPHQPRKTIVATPIEPNRVEFLSDVEGDWDYFLRFVELSDVIFWRGSDNGCWGPGVLDLREGGMLIFGGDASGKGSGDLRFVKTLVDLKRRHPSRVHIILGDKDINRLRLFAELSPGEDGSHFEAYWEPTSTQYLRYIAEHQLARDTTSTLKWMFDCNMGCPAMFDARRQELALLSGRGEVSDEEVVRSFRSSVDPFGQDAWMLDFIRLGQLILVLDGNLFVHGSLTKEAICVVPVQDDVFNSCQEWADSLNAWKDEQLQDFERRPGWRIEEDAAGNHVRWPTRGRRRGGDMLMDYGLPNGAGGATIVCKSRSVDGDEQFCCVAVEEFLLRSGITHVFCGCQPDCPSIVRHPRSGILIMSGNAPNSNAEAPKEGSAATNLVRAVTVPRIQNGVLHISGQLGDGSKHRCALHRDHRSDRLLDVLVGRRLKDDSWVETVLDDGRLCCVQAKDNLRCTTFRSAWEVDAMLSPSFELSAEVVAKFFDSAEELLRRIRRLSPKWREAVLRVVDEAESGKPAPTCVPRQLSVSNKSCTQQLPVLGPQRRSRLSDLAADLRITEALESGPKDVAPAEVTAALDSLGFPTLHQCRCIKLSFHMTFILEFDGRIPGDADSGERGKAVLQLIGSELGDKPLFDVAKPTSTATIVQASSLASDMGICTPRIWATGEVAELGFAKAVPFIVYEFIRTATVDDVIAPKDEWKRMFHVLQAQLQARSLANVDTSPLPRFEDCFVFVGYLSRLAREAQAADLVDALERVERELREGGVEPVPPTLVHQDLNDGNMLCSPDPSGLLGEWRLDAVIDWKGAVVSDWRITFAEEKPWATLRKLSTLTKSRWLTSAATKKLTSTATTMLPRCCAQELIKDYDDIANQLVEEGWLTEVVALPNLP